MTGDRMIVVYPGRYWRNFSALGFYVRTSIGESTTRLDIDGRGNLALYGNNIPGPFEFWVRFRIRFNQQPGVRMFG